MESFDLFCVGSTPTFLSLKEARGLLYLYVHFIIVILYVQARCLRLGVNRRS